VGPVRGTNDLPNAVRKPYGPGWTLVGDAGLVMDPITGQGIGHAFRDAERLTEAIVGGFSGKASVDVVLADYERARNEATLPMYEFTTQLASFGPPKIEERAIFVALARNQAETNRFFGALTGAVPMNEYFTPGNLMKILGVAGMARIFWSKLRAGS